MKQSDARITLRLTQEEDEKLERVSEAMGCNKSEAMRRIVRATRLYPIVVVDPQPFSEEMLVAL